MKLQQFLDHHGVSRNPFAEEDAQTDPVFKEFCIASTYHPAWDKVYGDPNEPATSIVFGEKGSGKTAMRLQISRHIEEFNRKDTEKRLFLIHYDDFNPFLDRFRGALRMRSRRADKVLSEWKLWDHMDAILNLGVTGLIDEILQGKRSTTTMNEIAADKIDLLDRHQARDLLLLAAFYDQSIAETFRGRWRKLCKRLRFSTWRSKWQMAVGVLGTLAVIAMMAVLVYQGNSASVAKIWYVFAGLFVGAWAPYAYLFGKRCLLARSVVKNVRVGNHETSAMRKTMMHFTSTDLEGQPIPNKERTDDRYELLMKLQGILDTLGYTGIIVLVDRLDEPHLVNGSAELMKALLWPMLDNKFLKHPGLGIKLMLPIELTRFIDREERDFFQRARLDKQNMISSFEWTGEALFDVANARLLACSQEGRQPSLRDFFDDSITDQRLIEVLRALRVPRHLFKFLYRLVVAHCNAYTEDAPVWQIPTATLESTLALQLRDQDAFDRGLGAG